MTTKTSGGKVTGLIALTCEATVALQVGDFCMLNGNYTVTLADGSAPVLGIVSVRNVKRTGDAFTTTYPVANAPGVVTVEVGGFYVVSKLSGGAIAAGAACGIGAAGALLTAGGGVATIGIALTASTAANQLIDVLVSKSA